MASSQVQRQVVAVAAMDARNIKIYVLQVMKDLVVNSRGRLVTLRPSKLAQDISIKSRKSPRAESVVIRNFLEELVEKGLIKVVKRSARGKVYGIYRESDLWKMLVGYQPRSILSLVESVENGEESTIIEQA
ncbi:MAG: hypothetical protein ACP5NY_00490 [Thermocladium sp.]